MQQITNRQYRLLILAIWLFWSALLIGIMLFSGSDLITDPDDYMRMVEVRDWLGGQSWFDVSQHRINPPFGGSMHWSRWLDVPIAGIYLLGSAFLKPAVATQLAFIATPMLSLGVLMMVVASVTRKLSNRGTALVAIFLLPTFPLLLRQFLPGRIDHHGWQIVMACAALWGLLHKNQAKGGLIMAAALAFWMHISIEGLPFVAGFGVLLAFLHFFPAYSTHGPRDFRFTWFVPATMVFSALFLLSTRDATALATVYCDAVAWPLLVAMAIASAGVLLAAKLYAPRILAMSAVGVSAAIGAALYVKLSGGCALDPFGNLTPLVRNFWHETITEGLPITKQAAAIITVLLFAPLVALLTLRNIWSGLDSDHKKQWGALAFLLLFASAMSFYVQRTGTVAEAYAIPLFAVLAGIIVSQVQRINIMPLRVLLTTSLLIAMLPVSAFVAGNLAFAAPEAKTVKASTVSKLRPCDTQDLRRLPKGLIFTTMAAGPDILYHTQHSVYVSGYHRNHDQMHVLIATMLGVPDAAEAVLRKAHIDYVVICPNHFETQSYLAEGKANFASSLLSKTPPTWLRPVAGFEGSAMRIYRLARESPVKGRQRAEQGLLMREK